VGGGRARAPWCRGRAPTTTLAWVVFFIEATFFFRIFFRGTARAWRRGTLATLRAERPPWSAPRPWGRGAFVGPRRPETEPQPARSRRAQGKQHGYHTLPAPAGGGGGAVRAPAGGSRVATFSRAPGCGEAPPLFVILIDGNEQRASRLVRSTRWSTAPAVTKKLSCKRGA